ncbi:MAG: ferredoxin family protein [Planctomycetales bacterium]|nr:ferredoxin family protein [Planctomycetales bacterium]
MPHRLTVVISQSRSQNPKKRQLEEQVVAGLLGERGIDVTVVPHLYDLKPDGSGMLCLSGISGDLVVCSWLYPRAARWILDRNQIRGQEGKTLLKSLGETDDDDEADEEAIDDLAEDKPRVADQRELPARRIYCLDLRAYDDASAFREEIVRIATELATPTIELNGWINGNPKPEQMERYLAAETAAPEPRQATVIEEEGGRRWYPVIDLSRCTNCLECIDFCLFGVYGIDARETILVEQPDNCRQGCPACSRVCPENAIIFPQHKTPTIAGSADVAGTLKIDLSQLFGAPDPGAPGAEKAMEVAARERDEQLLLAGRDAVGMQVGMPKRHESELSGSVAKDQLDELIDSLDELDF